MAKPNPGTWSRFRPAANRAIATSSEQLALGIKLKAMDALFMTEVESSTPILRRSRDEIVRRRVRASPIDLLAECEFRFIVADVLRCVFRSSSSKIVEPHRAVTANQAQSPFFRIKREVVDRKAKLMIEENLPAGDFQHPSRSFERCTS